MKLSARNQLKGKIININQGAVIPSFPSISWWKYHHCYHLLCGGGRTWTEVGSDAYAVIKATNVMVGIDE